MKHIVTVLKMMRYNQRTLIWFEILYKLIGVTVFVPLLYGSFYMSLNITGYRYLTVENLRHYLSHPLVYLLLAIGIFLIVIYSMIDMSAVIYILHHSFYWKRVSIPQTLRFALRNTAGVRKKGNRRLFFCVALMFLFFSSAYIPELLASYNIENVTQLLVQHRRSLGAVLIILLLFLLVPFLRLLYSFHFYTLEDITGKDACEDSVRLGAGHRIANFAWILLVQVLCYLLYILLLAVGILVIIVTDKLFGRSYLLSSVSLSVIQAAMTILLVVFSMLGVPASTFTVSMLFYQRKTLLHEKMTSLSAVNRQKGCQMSERRQARREQFHHPILAIEMLVFAATIAACSLYVYRMHKGEMNLDVEYIKTMEVTAHRGASWFYPENTMSAFQGAIDAGADWIELDVHLSKDGQIFVMHDTNFKRTTGVNAKAWELTYAEIEKLDAGSFFNESFAGEKIPLLQEVIALAKENDVRLNIEIKPSTEEEGLEEKLVSLIQEENFEEQCVVTSQMYDSIVKVKEACDSITTVYVMSIAYGNIGMLRAADHFSVKSSSVTDSLVSRVHNQGKQIYAWTVNSSDAINQMIEKQVDNIITDNVPLAKKCINSKINSTAVNNYISLLNRQIRMKTIGFWK